VQGLEHKEVIVGELAAAQPGLGEAYRTLTLLRKYAHLTVSFFSNRFPGFVLEALAF
jgi:hypothetical protein